MAEAALKAAAAEETETLTDGFHLVIEALKLNGINTIYNVPGIPITDLGRMMQAQGMRVLSFRHEQNAGYAASIAGWLTKKPGVCMTVSAPGFLNGLTALAHELLGAIGRARFYGFDNVHVIADRTIRAILLTDGRAADHTHVREQVLGEFKQHRVVRKTYDRLVEFDVDVRVLVEMRPEVPVLKRREHFAQA